jgi:hypothetical protein
MRAVPPACWVVLAALGVACRNPGPNSAPALTREVELLLRDGCATLKSGETWCPDPARGIPENGCPMQRSPTPPPEPSPEASSARCQRHADARVTCHATDGSDRVLLDRVRELVAGGAFYCALREPGDVHCWGENQEGGLGDGSHHVSERPVRVRLPRAAVQIAAGSKHACSLLHDGELRCWGENSRGAVGVGLLPPCCDVPDPKRPAEYLSPQRVIAIPPVASVQALADATCALTRTGEVYCWGENGSGQLGSPPSSEPLPTPARVAGLPPVRQFIMSDPSCAITNDGDALCWGGGCPLVEPTYRPTRVRW